MSVQQRDAFLDADEDSSVGEMPSQVSRRSTMMQKVAAVSGCAALVLVGFAYGSWQAARPQGFRHQDLVNKDSYQEFGETFSQATEGESWDEIEKTTAQVESGQGAMGQEFEGLTEAEQHDFEAAEAESIKEGTGLDACSYVFGPWSTNTCPTAYHHMDAVSGCDAAATKLSSTGGQIERKGKPTNSGTKPNGCFQDQKHGPHEYQLWFNQRTAHVHDNKIADDLRPVCKLCECSYAWGTWGTNDCPVDYERIETTSGCDIAAAKLSTVGDADGQVWTGIEHQGKAQDSSTQPNGCFQDQVQGEHAYQLWFNTLATEVGNNKIKDEYRPLCQICP